MLQQPEKEAAELRTAVTGPVRTTEARLKILDAAEQSKNIRQMFD